MSGTWTGLAVALVVLVLLLVFLLLNLQKVEMNFYGAHVHAPLAVALLFAVVLGALLVFGVGGRQDLAGAYAREAVALGELTSGIVRRQ